MSQINFVHQVCNTRHQLHIMDVACFFLSQTDNLNISFIFNLVFSETLVPTNSKTKTKDTTATKLCTIIVRHISTKNQQLDFPNFHFSIVCSYCSIWSLIIKSGSKMVKISNASYENEIHRVDSTLNEDSKNVTFWPGRP